MERNTIDEMARMSETKKAPYDLMIMDIVTIPGTTGTGTKCDPNAKWKNWRANRPLPHAIFKPRDFFDSGSCFISIIRLIEFICREASCNTENDKFFEIS